VSESIEQRLRRYAEVLDEAGAEGVNEVQVAGAGREIALTAAVQPTERRRPMRVVGGLAVAASLIGAATYGISRTGDPRVSDVGEVGVSEDGASGQDDVANLGGGSWTSLPPAPISPRAEASAVWTGEEVIVWGGRSESGYFSDGAAYNPSTDSWRSISPNNWAGPGSLSVWTGKQMVVLAKTGGAVYDPSADAWTDLPNLDDGETWGFRSVAYVDGLVVGFGAVNGGDGITTVTAASIAVGDVKWKEYLPTVRANDLNATWNRPAVALADGTVVVSLSDTVGVRFNPKTGAWSNAFDFSDPNVEYIDGWFVRFQATPVAYQGALYSVLRLQRGDGSAQVGMLAPVPDIGFDGTRPFVDGVISNFSTVVASERRAYVWDPVGASVRVFDPISGNGVRVESPPGRHDLSASVVAAGDRLFIWGGDLNVGSVPEGASQASGDGSLWTTLDGNVPVSPQSDVPETTPESTSQTSPQTTGVSVSDPEGCSVPTCITASGQSISTIEIAPMLTTIDGIDPCIPGACPSIATMADGTVVAYDASANTLWIGTSPAPKTVAVEDAGSDGGLLAIGPDNVAYLVTQSATTADPIGDLVAVPLFGPNAGRVIHREAEVVRLGVDVDFVSTADGIAGAGCCGQVIRGPISISETLISWVDNDGRSVTNDTAQFSIEHTDLAWELVRSSGKSEDSARPVRWVIPESTNGFRGMPLGVARSDGGATLAWYDPIDGTQHLAVFRPSGAIERIVIPDGLSVEIVDESGAIIFDGARFQRWSLPTFTEPTDAAAFVDRYIAAEGNAHPTLESLAESAVSFLERPDGCEFAPTATATIGQASSGPLVSVDFRFGCDDSGGGARFDLSVGQLQSGDWAIESATQRSLCLRGGGPDVCS
jgi:hypothetical protein